jgi:hypothetical protein
MFHGMQTYAQEMPPRPLAVYLEQNLSFGAFYHGFTGGSVILYPDGSRISTGDVVLVNMGYLYFEAIFSIDANPGTLISILNGPPATLTGNTGGFMIMHVGESNPVSPFIATEISPERTRVYIGGVLIVGNSLANPIGDYSGSFMVTFIQE